MNRILKVVSLMVLTLLLSLPGSYAQADTATSGGQAIIPPFHLFYSSASDRIIFHLQLANISNESVHVVVKYFDQSGEVAKITEIDIAAKSVVSTSLDTSSTPSSTAVPFYGTIEWTGAYTPQKPLVAHAYTRFFIQNSTFRAQDANSIGINGGMPF